MDLKNTNYHDPLSAITKGQLYIWQNQYADLGDTFPLMHGRFYIPYKLVKFAQDNQFYQSVYDYYSDKMVWMLRYDFRLWEHTENSYLPHKSMSAPLYQGKVFPCIRDIKDQELRRLASLSNQKVQKWDTDIQNLRGIKEDG